MKHLKIITRGLGKKTKCGIAASQLATDSSAKKTKHNAAIKLVGCKKK